MSCRLATERVKLFINFAHYFSLINQSSIINHQSSIINQSSIFTDHHLGDRPSNKLHVSVSPCHPGQQLCWLMRKWTYKTVYQSSSSINLQSIFYKSSINLHHQSSIINHLQSIFNQSSINLQSIFNQSSIFNQYERESWQQIGWILIQVQLFPDKTRRLHYRVYQFTLKLILSF